jgi:hypothetical protein
MLIGDVDVPTCLVRVEICQRSLESAGTLLESSKREVGVGRIAERQAFLLKRCRLMRREHPSARKADRGILGVF